MMNVKPDNDCLVVLGCPYAITAQQRMAKMTTRFMDVVECCGPEAAASYVKVKVVRN